MWDRDSIENRRKEFTKDPSTFLVFDIETVIDAHMFEQIADEKEILKKENGEFLPAPFHRVICFSYLLVKDKKVVSFESYVSPSENNLILNFWSIFKKSHNFSKKDNRFFITEFPVLVSVNGKDFDLPVVKLRSLKYIQNIPEKIKYFISIYLDKFDKWEDNYPNYTNRYSRYHIDLSTDIFGGRKVSLKKLCYLAQIPVKQEAEGNQVQILFKEGNLEKIALYCAEDVKATAMLFAYINQHMLFGLYNFPDISDIQNIEPDLIYL